MLPELRGELSFLYEVGLRIVDKKGCAGLYKKTLSNECEKKNTFKKL